MTFRAVGALLAILAALLLALPVWFPWALRPTLSDHGVQFDQYERHGYGRFSLSRVRMEIPAGSFQADKMEAFQPTAWLWHRTFGGVKATASYIRIEGWRFQTKPAATKGGRAPRVDVPEPVFDILERMRSQLPAVRAWLPSAHLTNGAVVMGSQSITMPSIDWNNGRLSAIATARDLAQSISLDCDLSRNTEFTLSVAVNPLGLKSDLRLLHEPSEWKLSGEMLWRTNRVTLGCVFGPETLVPRTAQLEAKQIQISAEQLQLDGYRDLTGSIHFDWTNGQFDLTARASAQPLSAETRSLPPVHVEVNATGDMESALLKKLHIETPWLQADLTDNVQLVYTREIFRDKATLKLGVDLGKFPHPRLGGSMDAQVQVEPSTNEFPRAQFTVSGSKLSVRHVEITGFRAKGRFDWPMLVVEEAEANITNAAEFTANARLDLAAHQIAEAKWKMEVDAPGGFPYAHATYRKYQASGNVSGQWNAPSHSGELTIDGLSTPWLRPATAQLKWNGKELTIESIALDLTAGQSTIAARGSAQLTGKTCVTLEQLTLTRGAEPLYRLAQPCRIELGRADGGQTFLVEKFQWNGEAREVRIDADAVFPRRGKLELTARGITANHFADFLIASTNEIQIGQLDLSADWNQGPASSKLDFQTSFVAPDGTRASANGKISGDAKALTIAVVALYGQTDQVLSIHGTLPVQITPARWPDWWEVDAREPINLQASTEPNAGFWKRIDEMTGVRLVGPKLQLALRGTPSQPEGTMQMSAEAVELKLMKIPNQLPRIGDLALDASITPEQMALKLELKLEDQRVIVNGSLPLEKNDWRDLLKKRQMPDWRKASARLQVSDASVAPFAPYLPTVLTPQGRLTVDLTLKSGGLLDGNLSMSGVATRPVEPIGPIREIEAEVRFADRHATIEKFSGLLGGQPVSLTGSIDLTRRNTVEFDLALRGQQVPLARQPGLILRSDLDLKVVRTNEQPPSISGEMRLGKSLFLRELNLLTAGKLDQPTRSPPYFEVREPPFDRWTLDLKIHGDRFLRVRSPVFSGEISATLDLAGPLSEPTALGEVRVNSGTILFPFGTLTVDYGSVNLTSADPHRPQLFITASGRSFGYNVHMEAAGYADDPRVQFTATPPLSNEEILLMLTAGELPRQEFAFSSREKASRLAFYLGRDLLMRLGIGVETAERITIRSGEDVSEAGNLTYRLEYHLTDRWAAFGEYDRFNAFNAGLKFRLYSK